jgi:hypothetical protein
MIILFYTQNIVFYYSRRILYNFHIINALLTTHFKEPILHKKKLKTDLIAEILKINTTLLESFLDDFKKSIMATLRKKSKSTKCEEYRTLSTLTHTSKILTKIILGQIEKKIDENLAENQFGFRKTGGTREGICVCETLYRNV